MSYARTNPTRPGRVPPRAPPCGNPPANHPPSNAPNQQQTLEYCGAFSKKAPDPAKREKIKRVAEAEAQAYDHFKQQQKKPQYHTTVGTVGTLPSRELRSQYSSTSAQSRAVLPRPGGVHSTTIATKRGPSLRSQTVRMEDPEIERRKAIQRQKADVLEVKKIDRQQRLDQDRRSKNNDFLDRLTNNY